MFSESFDHYMSLAQVWNLRSKIIFCTTQLKCFSEFTKTRLLLVECFSRVCSKND